MSGGTYSGPDPTRPLPPEQEARRLRALQLAAAAFADIREEMRVRANASPDAAA